MNHRGMSGQLRSEPQTRAVGRMKKLKLNFFAENNSSFFETPVHIWTKNETLDVIGT